VSNPRDPGSWNRYAYVEDDPVNFFDPRGLDSCPPDSSNTCVEVYGSTVDVDPSISLFPSAGTAYNLGLGYSQKAAYLSSVRNLARAYSSAVSQGYVSDCNALADFAQNLVQTGASASTLVQDFGVLTPSAGLTGFVPGISSTSNPVQLNTGQSSGFLSQYQNTLPDNPATGWNGDQAHHFAAFFQFGYVYSLLGFGPGAIASFALEYAEGLDSGIMNLGDVNLGDAAVQIGEDLASGKISTADVAGRIKALCNN
jgi:hypothetical protein